MSAPTLWRRTVLMVFLQVSRRGPDGPREATTDSLMVSAMLYPRAVAETVV
jgi:hypothetical protein